MNAYIDCVWIALGPALVGLIQHKIVVGHSVDNDLMVLGIGHPIHNIRDTADLSAPWYSPLCVRACVRARARKRGRYLCVYMCVRACAWKCVCLRACVCVQGMCMRARLHVRVRSLRARALVLDLLRANCGLRSSPGHGK